MAPAMLKLSIRTWLLSAALIAVVAPPCAGVILCRTVYDRLNPCYDYVTGNGQLGGCCGGVKRLYGEARTTADKQSVCRCLKDVARTHSRINVAKAANLPGICGVNIPYTISRNIDCSKVR